MTKRERSEAKRQELQAECAELQRLLGTAFERWCKERWPHRVRRRLEAVRRLISDEVQRGRYPRSKAENDNEQEA